MSSNPQYNQLTEKEKKVLGLAWECFEGEPKIDWKKLADLGGYTNQKSVMNVLRGARKKLHIEAGSGSGENNEESAASPKTPKGRKRGSTGIATPATPGKGKNKRIAKEEEEEEDGGDIVGGGRKKLPTLKKAKTKAGNKNDNNFNHMLLQTNYEVINNADEDEDEGYAEGEA